ncbi:MAG: TonB-dependent receptor plug domain-containing protein, partial [bacterium]
MIGFRNTRIPNVNVSPGDTAVVKVRLHESPIEIDPVVVTVSKWKQEAEDTPAAIEVLTAKDILQRSPLRIEDALETAAGVQILQENINIRGSDGFTLGIGSRVLVMMDGVPIMTSDMGSVNWFMVSPADIERAEIVRGAGSAVYGSSAMGGVVNFITRSPGPKPRTYVRTMAGLYDDFAQSGWDWTDEALVFNRVDFTHSQQINNLDVRVSGGQSFSKGYTQNSSYTRYNFSGKLGYRFPDNSKLIVFGNYMHDDSEVFVTWDSQSEATKVAKAELGKEQTRNGITVFAKYSRPIASNATVEFRGYFNRFLLGIQFTDVNFSPALGLGGAIQGFYLPWKNLSLIWGGDFKRDQTKSDVYGDRDAWLVAPFLQAEWQFHPNFNFTLGARYDRYDIPATSDTTVRLTGSQVFEHFSPKVGLNYHPFESTTLRGSVSNGFKFPAIFQLFFDNQEITNITFVANDSLRSEKAWSYEVGLRQKISPTWFFEVNGFYTNVSDLIEAGLADIASLKAAFLNTDEVAIPGVEFVSNGRWWDNRLGLRVNLTYLDPHNKRTNQLL